MWYHTKGVWNQAEHDYGVDQICCGRFFRDTAKNVKVKPILEIEHLKLTIFPWKFNPPPNLPNYSQNLLIFCFMMSQKPSTHGQYGEKATVEYLTLLYHSHARPIDKASSFTEFYWMTLDLRPQTKCKRVHWNPIRGLEFPVWLLPPYWSLVEGLAAFPSTPKYLCFYLFREFSAPHLPNPTWFWVNYNSWKSAKPSTNDQYGGKSHTGDSTPLIGFQCTPLHLVCGLRYRVILYNSVNEEDLSSEGERFHYGFTPIMTIGGGFFVTSWIKKSISIVCNSVN